MHIFDGSYNVMDLTMLLRVFYLFIELLTVKENVCICHLMSFNAI